jgi:hypothetical protein
VQELVDATNYAATLDSIDDPINMEHDRIWIFSGELDTVVHQVKLKDRVSDFRVLSTSRTSSIGIGFPMTTINSLGRIHLNMLGSQVRLMFFWFQLLLFSIFQHL